ncbi:putative L-lysine 2; 3-aminomutase [Paratrimastix pyriformis]|uniref:L-lysine 2 n=1 Tax=Paratrimastix pyriformis TaxID=342808 RepID=A0ABQ8UCH3_9EUKA|nr:putative L-lysine 2; 3-aminomutase [Paratrimastix pyriformis]|eukprot:GAFH01000999.1.p1 GENE.GAFH01000999.1~~GAFH01000999.1.p1  ORF type:complete len:679 (-),score=129.04 GAFH01000999.1:128-2104(-)
MLSAIPALAEHFGAIKALARADGNLKPEERTFAFHLFRSSTAPRDEDEDASWMSQLSFVVSQEGNVVGWATYQHQPCSPNEFALLWFYVQPAARRAGAGTVLWNAALSYLHPQTMVVDFSLGASYTEALVTFFSHQGCQNIPSAEKAIFTWGQHPAAADPGAFAGAAGALVPVTPALSMPAQRSPRPPFFAHIPESDWFDWKWQMAHRLSRREEFETFLRLSPEEIAAFEHKSHFPVAVTPYIASLMDPDDPKCPLRMQFLPNIKELADIENATFGDSLDEEGQSPVPGLVHRYPDRCIMLVSMICACYCRFCTRNRVVGNTGSGFGAQITPFTGHGVAGSDGCNSGMAAEQAALMERRYRPQLDYIRRTVQIRDVLLTGGDCLLLPTSTIEFLLRELRAIDHVEVIRIGSRVPIVCPMRIQPDLVNMLRKYHPLWINTHANSPKEISPEAVHALGLLADAGIPLGDQTVLMAGVNDCPNIMLELMQRLVKARVRPYYMYQCDEVTGAAHFRTPVSKGIEIIEAIRGHTSGFCVPVFVVDCPHGGGKVPVLPNYLITMGEKRVVLRNFEGYLTAYDQPRHYAAHDSARCPFCTKSIRREQLHRQRLGAPPVGPQNPQGIDVSGLLAGRGQVIEPTGWHETHHRGGCCEEEPEKKIPPP